MLGYAVSEAAPKAIALAKIFPLLWGIGCVATSVGREVIPNLVLKLGYNPPASCLLPPT